MRLGRSRRPIELPEEERAQLQTLVGSNSLPYSLVVRARLVHMSADGVDNHTIGGKLSLSAPSVSKWRQRYRYLRYGIQGLYDQLRPGRPRSISDEKVATLVRKTLETKPKDGTHWSLRSMARKTRLSHPTVHRIWQAFGLQQNRYRNFKLSADPFFVEEVREIVGLYLNPPQKGFVLCMDEKSQIQALDRTQPMLPMGLGSVEGMTHDYKRHGTTMLLAALEIANSRVLTKCSHRHRHQECLNFLKRVDENDPRKLDVHVILDKYSTHKHATVRRRFARHPRWHVHYVPTHFSWLDQVEIWFNHITQKAIRRGASKTVKDLIDKIEQYVRAYNTHEHRFVWTVTADSILAKIQRLTQAISETAHELNGGQKSGGANHRIIGYPQFACI